MDSARNKVQRIRVLQHRQMIQFENEANCASTDPEIFFPKNRGGYDHMPMLKIVCGSCFAKDESMLKERSQSVERLASVRIDSSQLDLYSKTILAKSYVTGYG